MKCHLCDAEAIAIFYFNKGCICNKDHWQPLCCHHTYRSQPIGTMELFEDLTLDNEFSKGWRKRFL